MNRKSIFVFGLSSLLIVSCSKKNLFDSKAAATPPPAAVPAKKFSAKDLNDQNLQISITPGNSPNVYVLSIDWPSADGNLKISYDDKVEFTGKSSVEHFEDNLKGGSEFTLTLDFTDDENATLNQVKKQITVPLDYVFAGRVVLDGDFTFLGGRVFFQDSTTIDTGTHSMNIVTNELVSDSAVIETFPAGTAATWETPGRSGGSVSIQAKEASGALTVYMRGENGGSGKNAPRFFGRTTCMPGNGSSGGASGKFNLTAEDGPEFKINLNVDGGAGGSGGATIGVDYKSFPSETIRMPPCQTTPDRHYGANGPTGTREQSCYKLTSGADYVCN